MKSGLLREGIWRLNRERSNQLLPADQTLWVIRDDGERLAWVIVSTDAQGQVRINSWQGNYDGEAAPVLGAGMISQLRSKAPGTFESRGEIEGLGPFSEQCTIAEGGKRFVCHGEVHTADGIRRWIDDFEWISPGPGSPA